MAQQPRPTPVMPNYVKFIFGGTAGMMATCFTQPLDLLKNRMQMSGADGAKKPMSTIQVFSNVIAKEGIFAIYNGLSAGLLRQASYTTARMGVFQALVDGFTTAEGPPGFAAKAGMGMVAGIVGAFIGTPTEVALIRMTSDGRLPPAERQNYKSVVDVFIRVLRTEGIFALWRGAVPTMSRAMLVNAAQLASYSQSKEMLVASGYFGDNIFCHITASMMSGLLTTIVSMPVDIAKTRIQNMKVVDGKPQYTGQFDVITKVIRYEGVFALWRGFIPYYMRMGPQTVLTFVFLEQLNKAYYKYA